MSECLDHFLVKEKLLLRAIKAFEADITYHKKRLKELESRTGRSAQNKRRAARKKIEEHKRHIANFRLAIQVNKERYTTLPEWNNQ